MDDVKEEMLYLTDEGCSGTLTIELLLYFFPGLSIGLKQFGIAPCITPFSSIE